MLLILYVLFAELQALARCALQFSYSLSPFQLKCFPTLMLQTCFIAAKSNQLGIYLCASF